MASGLPVPVALMQVSPVRIEFRALKYYTDTEGSGALK